MDPMILSAVVFLSVTGVIAALAMIFSTQTSKAEERLHIITGKKSAGGGAGPNAHETIVRSTLGGLSTTLANWFSMVRNLGALMEQADCAIKSDVFLGICGASAVVGVVGAMAGHAPQPMYPVAALCGGFLPVMWLMWKRNKRFKAFAQQLPEALELLSRSLRSGHSLASGIHAVANEMPEPISKEFNMVFEEQNLGIPLEHALKSMLKRVPNMDLKFFVTAVAIQRQSGGDLSEILDKIGHIVRERFRIMGAVQALTGEGRISGIVLMALPIALFFAVYYLNAEYVMLLFTDELGRKMLAGAAVLQVLGAYTIKKIVNIKI
jgi:tight adherence protein B